MIDIRDISYTAGTPLTPISDGWLVGIQPPSVDTPSGEVVSRIEEPVIPTVRIPIPIPPVVGGIGGIMPVLTFPPEGGIDVTTEPIQDITVTEPTEVTIIPSPIIPIEPIVGEDVPLEAVPPSDIVTTPISITQPIELPDIKFPDILGGIGEFFKNALPILVIGIVAYFALKRK